MKDIEDFFHYVIMELSTIKGKNTEMLSVHLIVLLTIRCITV